VGLLQALLLAPQVKQEVLLLQVAAAAAVAQHAQALLCTGSRLLLDPVMHLQDPCVCQMHCLPHRLGRWQQQTSAAAAAAGTLHQQQQQHLQALQKIKPWQLAAAAALLALRPAMLLPLSLRASLRSATGAS
jgi:hypothetical protein